MAIPTDEKCERCGGQIIEWKIGTDGYAENHTYFYLCKKCSRELDKVEKANPNEKGGVVGLCTKGNIRFACWVKTGRIMPYDEAIKLLEDDKYVRELKRLWSMRPPPLFWGENMVKKKVKRKVPMKHRTFLMPGPWHLLLAELVREGYYPSISAALRSATRDLLKLHDKI